MFDIRSDRIFEFIDGINQSLSVFNKKMYPLKVADVELVVCNRKDDYHFNEGFTVVDERIVCEKETEWAIRRMSGTTSFYLDLTLNDCTYIRVVVEDCVGSKYKMRLISSDNTYRFIHRDFVKKVWSGQKWSIDFSDTLTAYTCRAEEFHKLLHPDYCAVLMMPNERGNIPDTYVKNPECMKSALHTMEVKPTVVSPTGQNIVKEEKRMQTYFNSPMLHTPDEPEYLKEVRYDVVAVSRTSTPGSTGFNPEIVQKVIASLPPVENDFGERKALIEAAKLNVKCTDYTDPEKVYAFIEAYVNEFNSFAEACTARTGIEVKTVYMNGLRPVGYLKPEERAYPVYTDKMLTAMQSVINALTEKGCTCDKMAITFYLNLYKEEGATELKLDVKDISKYHKDIVSIAGENSWVKIDVSLPFEFKGGKDTIRIYIYEEDGDTCIDYWSEKDNEMFAYVGPRPKGPILNKPIEGGSYEGDVSLIANIIHPDWFKKTSRTFGGSLLDIIKGI